MAKPPQVIGAPQAGDDDTKPLTDDIVPAADDAGEGVAEEDAGLEVLVTGCKEADGTYRLIQGDMEDAEAAPEGEGMGTMDEEPGKIYGSPGALLKAIL